MAFLLCSRRFGHRAPRQAPPERGPPPPPPAGARRSSDGNPSHDDSASRVVSVPWNVLGRGLAATAVCSATMLGGCGGGSGTSSPGTQFGHATASGKHAEAQAVGRTDPFDTLAIG